MFFVKLYILELLIILEIILLILVVVLVDYIGNFFIILLGVNIELLFCINLLRILFVSLCIILKFII